MTGFPIAPSSDSVTISKGLYTKSKKEWRIDGTSTVLAGQTVTVHLGGLNGPVRISSGRRDRLEVGAYRARPASSAQTGLTVSVRRVAARRDSYRIRDQGPVAR